MGRKLLTQRGEGFHFSEKGGPGGGKNLKWGEGSDGDSSLKLEGGKKVDLILGTDKSRKPEGRLYIWNYRHSAAGGDNRKKEEEKKGYNGIPLRKKKNRQGAARDRMGERRKVP